MKLVSIIRPLRPKVIRVIEVFATANDQVLSYGTPRSSASIAMMAFPCETTRIVPSGCAETVRRSVSAVRWRTSAMDSPPGAGALQRKNSRINSGCALPISLPGFASHSP